MMLAGDFKKVLEFMVAQANHDPYAPAAQKGIQVILNGRKVSIISVSSCSTTTVELLPQAVSGGGGVFFVPFDDVDTLMAPLGHDSLAGVTLSLGEQPLVKGMLSLHVAVGDWFTADIGHHKPNGLPKHSANKSTSLLDYATVRSRAKVLAELDAGGKIFGHRKVGANRYEVFLLNPAYGIKSVVKKIY